MSKTRKQDTVTEQIPDSVVDKAFRLARLDPTSVQMEEQKEHFRRILDFFNVLKKVNVEGIESVGHVIPSSAELRPDEVEPGFDRETAMANSSMKSGEYFKSPQILSGEEPGLQ